MSAVGPAIEASDDPDAFKMNVPMWSQTICIVWPLVATLVCFIGPLGGSPASIRALPFFLGLSVIALALFYGVLILERWAYICMVVYAALWSLFFFTFPAGGIDPIAMSISAVHLIVVAAAWICARSPRFSDEEAGPKIGKSRRIALWTGASLWVVAAGIYVNSFRTESDGTGRLTSREELVGEWWGTKDRGDYERVDDPAVHRITRLSLGDDGIGQISSGSLLLSMAAKKDSFYGPYRLLWLMRGHQLHFSKHNGHGYYTIPVTPMLSKDGNSMTLPTRNYLMRDVRFFKSGTPEAKRLEEIVRKAAEELRKAEPIRSK